MSEQASGLFGFKRSQGDLFANEPARNNGIGVADPNDIRARLHKMLTEARTALSTPPWNERTTRLYQVIFPQTFSAQAARNCFTCASRFWPSVDTRAYTRKSCTIFCT